jgi:hypothetical protein
VKKLGRRDFITTTGLGVAALPTSALLAKGNPQGHGSMGGQLQNDHLACLISERGSLQRIDNRLTGESHEIEEDSFSVETDIGTISNRNAAPREHSFGPNHARFTFSTSSSFDVVLEYSLGAGHKYFRRRLALANIKSPLTLLNVELGRTTFKNPPRASVKYDTFWNAPTVSFLRWGKGGLFAGIENPFFETAWQDREVKFSFEPAMILKAGETYESEPQFVGVYQTSGRMVRDQLPLTRLAKGGIYRPRFRNPSGHLPLDGNEIRAMREFAAEYLQVPVDRFLFILYCFWNPMPQIPSTDADEQAYFRMIDTFHELGGDLIIFNPLVKARIPTEDPTTYWELAPAGSMAQRILAHATERGIKYGFYIGVAAQMEHGNAAALPFAPRRQDWKRVDSAGAAARENCLASDEYAKWWYEVQRNTIAKYKLALWSWDPGPGHGFFCYSNQHGHLPGKGGYKGWRNSTEIMRRLKEEFPGLYYQGFYGRKEYGLWGQKYTDQHEFYWEQYFQDVRSLHPDLHADRLNADGVRMQTWWSENFRFLPTVMNHAIAQRMNQLYAHPPDLKKLWDHIGWKYAFMSALAVGGSLTAPFMPENPDDIAGYQTFYRKWLEWARKNFEYVKYGVSFGDQVTVGGIDGHARIKGDHGYIFLCNPNPRPTRTQFQLNDEIGLFARGRFTLKELYPDEATYYFDEAHKRGIYSTGDAVSIVVPAYEVTLLELSPFQDEQLPLLFGASARSELKGSTLHVSGLAGEQGGTTRLAVATRTNDTPKALSVNGRAVATRREDQYLMGEIHFAGRELPRYLDDWRTPEGEAFSFPYHAAYESISLTTRFTAELGIRASLKSATPRNAAEIEAIIRRMEDTGWEIPGLVKESKFPDTFPWARPDRLLLVIPFTDAQRIGAVELQLNGVLQPVRSYDVTGGLAAPPRKIIYYADLTDTVKWGEANGLALRISGLPANQFLGPYLDYPPAPQVSALAVRPGSSLQRVVYDRPVQAPPKEPSPSDPVPVILSAWMDPVVAREGQKMTFVATTNLPPDQIQAVYLSSIVGPDCWTDQELKYDPKTDQWSLTLRFGERVRIILDCPFSYVWAVARNGHVSEPWKIPMKWLFSK